MYVHVLCVVFLQSLLDIGIVPGYDMTSEAALAKLSYVLTKPWSLEKKKEVRGLPMSCPIFSLE